jgi:putative SOS response-associated peptidase YedK
MCGRYTDTRRDKAFLARFGVQADFIFTPRYNIAPTQEASIIVQEENGSFNLRQARWGLVPSWAKDAKIASNLVNARSETIATKPAFRTAYRKRRCLVLADGFYEWRKIPGGKEPTHIRMHEGKPFAFGGLWESWRTPDGLALETFCLITLPPNDLCARIHNRMPLIVPEPNAAEWLDGKSSGESISELLKPYPSAEMECYPVSALVNSARNETAECVRPLARQLEIAF